MVIALLLAIGASRLHVDGTQLVENGQVVRLQGLTIPSFEWSNEGEFVFRSTRVALEDWHANCVRLPVCPDRWFGKAKGQKDGGEDYRQAIQEVVSLVTSRNCFLVIAATAAEDFWKAAARRYRDEPHVLFELTSDPKGLKAIRSMRAQNVVIVPSESSDPNVMVIDESVTTRPISARSTDAGGFEAIEKRNLSWVADNFHPTTQPNLITDWKYTPTDPWGKLVRAKLTALPTRR